MRLLYATQWFDPEPVLKGLNFAQALARQGHDVCVVTGFPNYPGGKIYPGYAIGLLSRYHESGVTIDRIPLYPSHSKSRIGRVINYLSFAASLTLYSLARARNFEAIYAYHPPITVALATSIGATLWRRPLIVEIQDLWPDTLAATSMVSSSSFLSSLTDRLCRLVYRRAARIIVQSPGFKRALTARGVGAEKIEVIENWADEVYTKPRRTLDLNEYNLDARFNVIFAGTLGLAQDLDNVIEAAKLVALKDPRVQFLLIGDGVQSQHLKQRVREETISNVRIMSRVPKDQIADLLAAADLLLVTLKADPLFEMTIPSKVQFYLAMGKPILIAARGDAASLVRDAGAGRIVQPGAPESLARHIISFAQLPSGELEKMGRRGAEFYLRNLSMTAGIHKTLNALQRIYLQSKEL